MCVSLDVIITVRLHKSKDVSDIRQPDCFLQQSALLDYKDMKTQLNVIN